MPYTQSIHQDLAEMWALLTLQHKKCLEALTTSDKDLAREVLLIEERLHSCEQFIEAHVQRYLAAGGKEAGVGMALFALKTARRLSGIGEQGKKIAGDILQSAVTDSQLQPDSSLALAFKNSNSIIELALTAFAECDATLVPLLFGRIDICRNSIAETKTSLAEKLRNGSNHEVLQMFSITETLSQTVELSHAVVSSLQNYAQASVLVQ